MVFNIFLTVLREKLKFSKVLTLCFSHFQRSFQHFHFNADFNVFALF